MFCTILQKMFVLIHQIINKQLTVLKFSFYIIEYISPRFVIYFYKHICEVNYETANRCMAVFGIFGNRAWRNALALSLRVVRKLLVGCSLLGCQWINMGAHETILLAHFFICIVSKKVLQRQSGFLVYQAPRNTARSLLDTNHFLHL